MGHVDTAMIYRNHGRWIPDAAPEAGNRAVEMFCKPSEKAAITRLKQTNFIAANL
jgi:hypothetical protein